MSEALTFRIDSSTEEDMRAHLLSCDQHFRPPLSQRVDLGAYSRKLKDNAVCVEAWEDKMLVGLVAGYMDRIEHTSYVSSVSVLRKFAGDGIATKLLNIFVARAQANAIGTIALEVSRHNPAAVHLFSKFGFRPVEDRGEFLLMQAQLTRPA